MSDLIARNQVMQREMLATVDRFVLLTEWALEAAAANGAPRGKLALNRLGFSQGKVEAKPGPDEQPTGREITIGYLGRYDAIKGVHDLARAAASLPRDAAIRVEFRGPVRSAADRAVLGELRDLTADAPRITFAAAVPEADALQVLAGYDVLCCPSVCLEGGPTVAIEAHAVGTPVIGTSIGGLAELVTDGLNGRLVAPGDWRALAGVLASLADDHSGTIDRWRRRLPPARTMDQVAADYLAVYAA
jgi:glycosyltransferase involved in cell wall biosynthesis